VTHSSFVPGILTSRVDEPPYIIWVLTVGTLKLLVDGVPLSVALVRGSHMRVMPLHNRRGAIRI